MLSDDHMTEGIILLLTSLLRFLYSTISSTHTSLHGRTVHSNTTRSLKDYSYTHVHLVYSQIFMRLSELKQRRENEFAQSLTSQCTLESLRILKN